MNKVFINEPLSFEIWIALMLAQQPIEDSLKALKISNLEKSNIQNFVNLIKILPKVESKQDLITVVYDYNLSDIECVLTANDTLKKRFRNCQSFNNQCDINQGNRCTITNPHSKGNGRKWGDIIKHLQVKSGPWLKDVLRQIELAIITQQMNNTKLEILEWVDANVKV